MRSQWSCASGPERPGPGGHEACLVTTAVDVLKLTLEALSALCVGLGLLSTMRLALTRKELSAVRLHFGEWLALALEFQLGADIVGTTIAPSFEALGKLALIAMVRTFLNFFLQRELEQARSQ